MKTTNGESNHRVQEKEPDVLHEGIWGNVSASLQGQQDGKRLTSLGAMVGSSRSSAFGVGALRVSLDRKVRSGVGSLTSQAEQFDSIMLAREDAKWPWQRVLWLSLRLEKLPLTGKRNWGSEIQCSQLILSLTILCRLASETLVSCRAPRKLAPFECRRCSILADHCHVIGWNPNPGLLPNSEC